MGGPQIYQSAEEVQEILLQELENLFDRPCLIPVMSPQSSDPKTNPSGSNPTPFKVGLEKDNTNTFLITNPQAIFRVFSKDQFLSLPETTQCILLERLEEILIKCPHNSLILTDHIVQANPSTIKRISQTAINNIKVSKKPLKRASSLEVGKDHKITKNISDPQNIRSPILNRSHSSSFETDFLLSVIHMALKLASKSPVTSKKLVDLIKKLTYGRRFFRCHVEFIYQYLKIKCSDKCVQGKNQQALTKVDTGIKILQVMYENKFEVGPSNFFYFSGYLSGIQVNTKQLPQSEFTKVINNYHDCFQGFAAAMWFQIHENTLQDDKNLPVLFNCFFQGFGGFECYFNHRKLFYRILPKNYSPPNVESNGVPIFEFQPKKWYFFAIEHERPFMTRPQFTAIVNDSKVMTLPMDYPKIEKNAKISMIVICQNFVGEMSSFMLFKDSISNNKKLIQMGHTTYEYGLYSQQQLASLKSDIFDQKFLDKILLFYSPERTSSNILNNNKFLDKTVYDCIEMRDGEMMINSGVCHVGTKQKLFFTGGLNSVLPMLEILSGIAALNKGPQLQLDTTLNEYLKLIISHLSSRSFISIESENQNFFSTLFFLISKLPQSSMNSQTIQNLADIRFHIGENQKLQEQFFLSLMMSCDFWMNTDNIEVVNEYWLFVKAIYQQNPVSYNKIFSIQKLIDLMVKISDIKDGHCCEFHRDTYMIFYEGVNSNNNVMHQNSLNQWVIVERKSLIEDEKSSQLNLKITQNQLNSQRNPFDKPQNQNLQKNVKIHNIDKYLSPIAGVLEGVLTCGGNEVIEQIQSIAKALTLKSTPCFHLQMLKLLKVLLLDSKEDIHCASPAEFASELHKSNGVMILLHLCSSSSFDVKAMCLKLIDVLSSHTSHIKVSIDPDVITYLCSIILPKQMMDSTLNRKNQQIFNKIALPTSEENQSQESESQRPQNLQAQQQYVMVDEDANPIQYESFKEVQLEDSQELEKQMNQLLAKQPPLIIAKKKENPQLKKFGKGLFIDNKDNQENQKELLSQNINEDDESQLIVAPALKMRKDQNKGRISLGGFAKNEGSTHDDPFSSQIPDQDVKVEDIFKEDDNFDDEEQFLTSKPPPPAPKN